MSSLKWTSVTDDMPREIGKWVLVLAPGRAPSLYAKPILHDPIVTMGEFERQGVTHWMGPLPPFPEEESP